MTAGPHANAVESRNRDVLGVNGYATEGQRSESGDAAVAMVAGTMAPATQQIGGTDGFPTRELWEKYEDIAMHFNDLIIKLRTQALAGVVALSTLVGFSQSGFGRCPL